MKLRKLVSLGLALAMSASVAAGVSAESRTNGAYPGTPGDDSLTLYITMEPTSLSTLEATYGEEFKVLNNLMYGLTAVQDDGTAGPGIAESWDLSDDALTYTFHLREAYWSNGDQVVASDFAFAWKMLMTPETGSEYAYFGYQLIKNGTEFYNGECEWEDVGVKVIDDLTLEVTLAAPTPYALDMFNFHSLDPINESFFNEIGGAENYNMAPEYFCVNGPYVLEDWTHDAELILKKNESFYDADKVSLNTLNYKILVQSDAKLNSFRAGEIDLLDLTGDQLTQMQNEGIEATTFLAAREYWILMNTEDEYLSNVNLRKAIDLSYSRQDFISAVLKDTSVPANTFCPSPVIANGSSFAEQALVALEAEGYVKDGYLRSPEAQAEEANAYLEKALDELGVTKEELSAHLDLHCSDSDESQNQAAFIQESIRQTLGLEISVTPMQTKAQSAERTNGNYVMDLAGWGADYNDPMTFFDLWVTGSGNNSPKFSNAEYDALIADALVNTDLAARVEDFIKCEKILIDEAPISPIYVRSNNFVLSDKVGEGYIYNAWTNSNFRFVTLNTAE